MRRQLRIVILSLVLGLPCVVQASHYDMVDITLVEPEVVQQLTKMGLANTEDVLHALKDDDGRAKVAAATTLEEDEVMTLARTVELLQIEGVGPKAARLLQESGVVSVADLEERDGEELLERLISTNNTMQITGINPDISVVNHWIQGARTAPVHLE